MPLAPGLRLGPYEILCPLGSGGMGEVYRGRDTRLERSVAIKVLPEHLSDHPERQLRLEREARAVSSLNHPNICALYDIGHHDGVNYLVLEYLEGETLAQRLEKGALPTELLLRCSIEIAGALEKAHRMGLVHRDLKPGNIMLTKTGAKLLDFGLAKTVEAASATNLETLATTSKPLTAEGTIVGTFQYMSPEQLEGKEADARSDIFSFGMVLYEMATGKKAFAGTSQASLIAAILAADPAPITKLQPMAPPALERVVKACLEKAPDERFQTAHDVGMQLKWIAEGGAHGEVAPSAERRLRLGWLAAGTALLLALVSMVAYLSRASRPTSVVRSSILPPQGTSFVITTPNSGPPVLSPDGTRLAFTARDDKGKVLLYVRALTSLTAQPLAGTDDAMYPFWAPDSRQIGLLDPVFERAPTTCMGQGEAKGKESTDWILSAARRHVERCLGAHHSNVRVFGTTNQKGDDPTIEKETKKDEVKVPPKMQKYERRLSGRGCGLAPD